MKMRRPFNYSWSRYLTHIHTACIHTCHAVFPGCVLSFVAMETSVGCRGIIVHLSLLQTHHLSWGGRSARYTHTHISTQSVKAHAVLGLLLIIFCVCVCVGSQSFKVHSHYSSFSLLPHRVTSSMFKDSWELTPTNMPYTIPVVLDTLSEHQFSHQTYIFSI